MDKSEKLIECVRPHRCLYDIGDVAYKNLSRKNIIWEHIAKELDETVEGVKIKWKHIRDGYTKYKRLRGVVQKKGEKKEKYHNWVWGPTLQFLDDCVQPRPRIKNLLPKKRKASDEPQEQQKSLEEFPSTSFHEQFLASGLLDTHLLNPANMSLNQEQYQQIDNHLQEDLSQIQTKNDSDQFHDNKNYSDSFQGTKNDSDSFQGSKNDSDPFQDPKNDSNSFQNNKNDLDPLQDNNSSFNKDNQLNQTENSSDQIQENLITVDVDVDTLDESKLEASTSTFKKIRKRKKADAVSHLFTSYAMTFKNLNPQLQASLKVNLAQLFYEAEVREIHCSATSS